MHCRHGKEQHGEITTRPCLTDLELQGLRSPWGCLARSRATLTRTDSGLGTRAGIDKNTVRVPWRPIAPTLHQRSPGFYFFRDAYA